MTQDRRTVLGLAGAGLLAAGGAGAAQAPRPRPRVSGPQPRLRNIDVTTLVTAAGPGLGVRTPRGVLDVAGVERDLTLGLPVTVAQLIEGHRNTRALAGLLADGAAKAPARHLVPEAKVTFGNILDNPPKIICVGLNYAAHAAEGGAPPPKEPILFNKYTPR